ncbi:helix-turn-helix transcriptional regulator [Flavobacterium sp. '19STA2R22 D10 B1']|uniref:helix-turn-helix transcriptional regulator n=1 Tax=Flavobacterium aerium TaxID=3037261 RepID=UPI00278C66FF|nr:YafY family protein [Flavobacterium sp. '19STA2R22 D10 B1']
MIDESPKRFDRIVAILIQLQSKKIVKAQELADRFDVSLRTIYRDIRTLEASGVPIYSEAGVGYSLVDGYRLPPVMFTREEASSFIAAEKLMQIFTDKEFGSHYASAMYKLKAVLRSTDKDWVSNIESKVVIQQPSQKLFNDKSPNTLTVLFESIAEKKQAFLFYQVYQDDVITERAIEPVGLFHDNNSWYVFAYCHLRKDYRQFRTDRIQEIKRTEKAFVQEHHPLETYLNKEKNCIPTKVRILINKREARYLTWEKKSFGLVSEKEVGNQMELTFMCNDVVQGFPRWYLMFGDYCRILEPESLKTRVLELLDINRKLLE